MLWEHREWIASVLVLIQKEVAERMASPPGCRTNGRLSIQWSRWFDSRIVGSVPPESFVPPPRVQSSILSSVRRSVPLFCVPDEGAFEALLKALFQHRRKTIAKALRLSGVEPDGVERLLSAAELSGSERPEALGAAAWERLARAHAGART
jgi:16S rRNA (adenine1518-N6/adenine1519-N6)-dimethyltransferase